jgi:hypothetical protein
MRMLLMLPRSSTEGTSRPSRDPWYPGTNAAYVLDLLAAQETPNTLADPTRIPTTEMNNGLSD